MTLLLRIDHKLWEKSPFIFTTEEKFVEKTEYCSAREQEDERMSHV